MADEETQNKPAIAQGKSTRTKKLLKLGTPSVLLFAPECLDAS
jgi:hypothetical protein